MKLIQVLNAISIVKTLYVNFRSLPFQQAARIPILVGKNVEIIGLKKNSIKIEGECKSFVIRLGVLSEWPIFSNKREWSMYRCSSNSVMEFDLSHVGRIVISSGFSIVNNGYIRIGGNSFINQHCTIYCAESIYLGNNLRVGWNTQIMDSDIHLVYDIENNVIYNPLGKVIVGDNVWIASNCGIMKGGEIPSYSIVANKSLVNKNFGHIKTKGNFFAGSPARFIKSGVVRLLDQELERKMHSYFSSTDEKYINAGSDFDYLIYCDSVIHNEKEKIV